jgi:hypothetical protein
MDCKTFEDGDAVVGTYCLGCRNILDEQGIEPGEHAQYRLMEGVKS